MKTLRLFLMFCLALFIFLSQGGNACADNMGTAFTYQGRLIDANQPADGLYDLQFKLFDSDSNGIQVSSDVNMPDVNVIDGYLKAELDFDDPNIFKGDARWLEIGIRPGDPDDLNVYTVLQPRQKVTPTPYALYAQSSGGLNTSNGNVEIGSLANPTTTHFFGEQRMYSTSGGGAGILGVYPVDYNGASYGEPSEEEWDFGADERTEKMSFQYTKSSNGSNMAIEPDGDMLIVGANNNVTDLSVHGWVFVHPTEGGGGGGGLGILGVYPTDFEGASYGSTDSFGGMVTGEAQDMALISGTGFVGVGKTNPQAALDVNGVIIASGKVRASAFASNSPLILEAPEGNVRMCIDDITGNVGIGTTSPSSTLSIGDVGNSLYKAYVYQSSGSDMATGLFSEVAPPASMSYHVYGVRSKATVTGHGYHYGVAASAYRSTGAAQQGRTYGVYGAAGNAYSGSNYGVYGILLGTQDGAAVYGTLAGDVSITGKWAGYFDGNVYANGNVGIGTTGPTEKLDVAGTARLRQISTTSDPNVYPVIVDASGKLWKTVSSKRYKTNIASLEINPNAVLQLRPVSFQYKSSGQQDIGLIAEEVDDVLSDLVIHDSQGRPDAVKYERVSLYLLGVVKAQQEKIAELEERLDALENTTQKPFTLTKEVQQ